MTENATIDPTISSGGQSPPAGSHVIGPDTDGSITVTGHPDNDTAGQDNPQQTLQPTPPQPSPQLQPQPLQPAPPATMQAPPKPTPPPIPAGVPLNSPYAYHPQVQTAGVQNVVARALVGDRWRTTIDPNTGTATRERIPMSRGDIGMSLALTALSGGIAGLAAQGPAHIGKAGLLGLEQGQKIAEEKNKRQQMEDEQNNKIFSRQIQTTEANLKMQQLAIQIGKMDQETHIANVNLYKDSLASIKAIHPEFIDPQNEHRSEAESVDVKAFPIHDFYRAPDGVIARTDPNNNNAPVYINQSGQVVPQGTPYSHQAWDNTYTMVHRDATLNLEDLDKGVIKEGQDYAQMPPGLEKGTGSISGVSYHNLVTNVGTLKAAQADMTNFHKYLTPKQKEQTGSATGAWQMDGTKPVVLKHPEMQAIANKTASKYGLNQNVFNALINQESGGNPNVGNSSANAHSVGQILPDTWTKELGRDIKDIDVPEKSIDGAGQYLRMNLDRFNGDYSKAIQAYFAGPTGVANGTTGPKTAKYLSDISSAAGLIPGQSATLSAPNLDAGARTDDNGPDLKDLIKGNRAYAKALVDFAPFLSGAGHDYKAAAKNMAGKSPQLAAEANLVTQAYDNGNPGSFQAFKDKQDDEKLQRDTTIKQNAELAKGAAERAQKNQENSEAYMEDAKAIAGDPNDPGSGDMVQLDKLISQRTADRPKVLAMIKQINPNFNMNDAEQKLHVWHSFADDTGKGTQQGTSYNALMQHIGQGLDINDAYRRTDIPYLNWTFNKINREALNDPQVKEFAAAQAPIKSEFLTLLQNNHALTESDKIEGEKLVNEADTPLAFEAVMKTIATTASIRIKATNSQWGRVFGQGRNVPGLIDEDTVHAISKLTNGDGTNKVAGILKDMDTGGTIIGSSNGRGVPGRRLADALGVQYDGEGRPPKLQAHTEADLPQGNGAVASDAVLKQVIGLYPNDINAQHSALTKRGWK